jgi:N6-adenosine-specific RNA methylase IME4
MSFDTGIFVSNYAGRRGPPPWPRKYHTFYADCPWRFLTYSGHSLPQRAKRQHYPTMTREELMALPVGELAEKDACLFMWILGSHVDQGFEVARSWGFRYTTDAFIWRKVKASIEPEEYEANDASVIGLGHWSRNEAELCFMFSRGRPSPRPGSRGVRQIINHPRMEHSRKPPETYRRIEKLSPGPRLELFARKVPPGWDGWGREPLKFQRAA